MEILLNTTSDYESGEVFFPLFKRYIDFENLEYSDFDYVEKCASYLNNLKEETINHLCEATILYCNDFLGKFLGTTANSFDNDRDILKLLQPLTLIIPAQPKSEEPAINLHLSCEWDDEHGISWIIRNDKVWFVGMYDGRGVWESYTYSGNYAYRRGT